MIKIFSIIFFLLTPIVALAETYKCTATNFGVGGWVSSEIILEFDTATLQAYAIDAAIYEVHKKPVPVRFRRRSDTSLIFNWTVRGVKSRNAEKAIISYKVTLFTDRNKFTLSGRLHGYDNVISASGTCAKLK